MSVDAAFLNRLEIWCLNVVFIFVAFAYGNLWKYDILTQFRGERMEKINEQYRVRWEAETKENVLL
jgi:hypothetical protein